jgi:alcohol dehydrogenase class IV
MTVAFDLALPGRISFGSGLAVKVPQVVGELGSRVLVATGSQPGRISHLLDQLADRVTTVASVAVAGEPTVEDARAAAEAGRRIGADVVLAIGGGSVIDLAKAAAMLVANGGDPLDYLEVVGRGLPITLPALPLVAVPTTAGTGTEVTANAVLSSPEHGVKASLRHLGMVPRHAIVDPDLTVGCPPAVTAASGMDALTQCLEPYVSKKANPVTDGWAATGMIRSGRSIVAAHADGSDLAARNDMALAALMGGLALANAKLGAVHGFAAVIGGMTQAPHGAICAALLAPVCRANLLRATPPVARRFHEVAQWLTGDPGATAEDGISWIEATRDALRIPGLAGFGLTAADAGEIAAKAARASSTAGNPVVLDAAAMAEIYLSAL